MSANNTKMSNTGSNNDAWKSNHKRQYRKQLAELTSYLALPEVLLPAKKADEIQIERVASKATKRLTSAFLNEDANGSLRSDDPKRMRLRELFLETIVEKGLKGKQVMPHEIIQTIRKNNHISTGMEMSLDAQWKSIWKGVVDEVKNKAEEQGLDFNPTRMVPICDVSGSMYGTPMEVSIAMGIGLSEITHPAFQNMVLTFSESPKWHRLEPSDTIVQKVRSLGRAHWGMSTDFEKAYDLVLETCVEHKLGREDMPCLIVFSDMQFDHAAAFCDEKVMFENIRKKVARVGKQLGWRDIEPSPIVFWNLRNSFGGHPVKKDTEGAVLLSGFSPSLLKLVMHGEALEEQEVEVIDDAGNAVTQKVRVTPEEILKKMLDDPLYDPVRAILSRSEEGVLSKYKAVVKEEEEKESVRMEDEFELV